MGVGRGIFLQLLRLSRETGPGHVGGRQGGRREWGGRAGGGEGASAGPTPGPSPGKQRVGECWKPLGPWLARQDTPLSLRDCRTPLQAGGRSARGAGPQKLGGPGVVRWMRRGEMSERCLSPWSPKD